MHTLFTPFTGNYPLSKTLRFSLLPQGATLTNMQKNGILQHDKQRDQDYETIKPLFDKLHNQFITESLSSDKAIDRSDFSLFYQAYKPKIKKDSSLSEKEKADLKAEFTSRLAVLRKEITNLYTITAEKRKQSYLDDSGKPLLTDKGYKILTEAKIIDILPKILHLPPVIQNEA
jgi:CRISPR-associated protein Cpf1